GWMTIHALTSVADAPPAAFEASEKENCSARPPPAAEETFRKSRREIVMATSSRLGGECSRITGRGVYRLAHAKVSAAAAEIRHRGIDVRIGRVRLRRQQRGRRHDHAGLAVTALRDFVLDPRFLHAMQAGRGKPFDGHDLLAERLRCR